MSAIRVNSGTGGCPNAAFTLYRTARATKPGDETEEKTAEEFRLGTFELRENISLSEK